MAPSRSIRSGKLKANARKPKAEAKKSKAESKTPKFKSSEFVFDSPPPPSYNMQIHSTTAISPSVHFPNLHFWNLHRLHHPLAISLDSPACPASSTLQPCSGTRWLDTLARMMHPPPSSNAQPQSIPPSLGQQQQPPLSPIPTQADQAADPPHLHLPSNPVYYEGVNHPHNPGYMGAHAATGFPVQYVNQPVAYHPQQAAHLPLQEGAVCPDTMVSRCQLAGNIFRWEVEVLYALDGIAGSGYGHPPMMTQQQWPPQQEQLYTLQVLIRFHTRASVNRLLCYRVMLSCLRVTLQDLRCLSVLLTIHT